MQVEFEILAMLLTLCAAGAVAGLTSGLFGNGGGFVVVPALLVVFPAFNAPDPNIVYLAIGTSLATIIISSGRAVQAHHAHGAVDFGVLRDWAIWLIIGVTIGLWIASLTDGRRLIGVFAAGVLVYSLYFLFPNALGRLKPRLHMPTGAAKASIASFLGGFSALLGIGGGTVTVMTMVICNRPAHQAVATAAGVGFIIALPGAIGFLLMGMGTSNLPWGSIGYVNLPALIAICALSVVTAPIGARWAHRLDEQSLKRYFGIYLVVVSVSMFYKSTTA